MTVIGLILLVAVALLVVVGVVLMVVRGNGRHSDVSRGNHPEAPYSEETASMQVRRQVDRGGMM